MDNNNNVPAEASEQQIVVAQVNSFRDSIAKAAIDNKLSFNVVFAALSQASAGFLFDFLFVNNGELTDDSVAKGVQQFSSQFAETVRVGFENMKEEAKAAAQEAAKPKITLDTEI